MCTIHISESACAILVHITLFYHIYVYQNFLLHIQAANITFSMITLKNYGSRIAEVLHLITAALTL
jgi:hypothetical protein